MLHAHVQLEFTAHNHVDPLLGKINPCQSEDLIGFDPANPDDVKMCHDMLDTYLKYLVEYRNKNSDSKKLESEHPDNHFEVFGFMDN